MCMYAYPCVLIYVCACKCIHNVCVCVHSCMHVFHVCTVCVCVCVCVCGVS